MHDQDNKLKWIKNFKLTLKDPLNILKKTHKSFNLKNSSDDLGTLKLTVLEARIALRFEGLFIWIASYRTDDRTNPLGNALKS